MDEPPNRYFRLAELAASVQADNILEVQLPALRAALYNGSTTHLQNIRKIYMIPGHGVEYTRTEYDAAVAVAKERASGAAVSVKKFKIGDLI